MLGCLVFSTTDKCPIECRYCAAECSPRNSHSLSFNDMAATVDSMLGLGRLKVVVFTGGEPFLLRDTLLRMVRYCADRNVKTRVVTNAYWAGSYQKAVKLLKTYADAGLTELNVSADDYHQAFIPITNVRNANNACRDIGLPCLLGHKVMKGCQMTLERLERALGRRLRRFEFHKENPDNDVVLTGYAVPIAKDMHLIPDEEILYPDDEGWKGPCDSVMENTVISVFRELSICCGMIPRAVREIVIGSLAEHTLEELIQRANTDLIVNWLALEGPYGVMKFIVKHKPEVPFRRRYVSRCHLCSEIFTRTECRKVLRAYAREKALELSLERALWDYVQVKWFREDSSGYSNFAGGAPTVSSADRGLLPQSRAHG
jgi:hypothetical protein